MKPGAWIPAVAIAVIATAAGTYIQVSVRTAVVAMTGIASAGIQVLGFIES